MGNKLTVYVSTDIKASPAQVWQALTDPDLIKQYLFGTNATSDWKKGSPISYTGEYEGQTYHDKGTIIDIDPEKLLHTTYFSSMSKKEDKPENYAHVIYQLLPIDEEHTRVTLSQDNIADEAGLQHMKENWTIVLAKMKELLEQ